jgi:predicted membrane channel-forming protein YqfA (hemolysin III family)
MKLTIFLVLLQYAGIAVLESYLSFNLTIVILMLISGAWQAVNHITKQDVKHYKKDNRQIIFYFIGEIFSLLSLSYVLIYGTNEVVYWTLLAIIIAGVAGVLIALMPLLALGLLFSISK